MIAANRRWVGCSDICTGPAGVITRITARQRQAIFASLSNVTILTEGDPMERRLVAILAADVAGYSRLMAANEAGTLARLQRLRAEVLEPKIRQFHGRIVGSA